MDSVMNIASEAMLDNVQEANELAQKIADPENGMDDIEKNIVKLHETENSFKANAIVIETADEMLDTLLKL